MEQNGNQMKKAQRDAARLANVRLAQAMMKRATAGGPHWDDYYEDEPYEDDGYDYDPGPPVAPIRQRNNRPVAVAVPAAVGPTYVSSSPSPSPAVLPSKLNCFFSFSYVYPSQYSNLKEFN
jgi:hypothetical protein